MWTLERCCQREEYIFMALYVVYYVLTHVFFWSDFNKPMKLLSVFIHEMGHASATWLTCGKVKKVEVYQNEGGVAAFSGGWRWMIITGGYVGGAFWGGAFVALSGHRIGATVAACIVSAALLIALCHNPNQLVVKISIGFSVITVAAILIDWFVFDPFLQYFTLYYGCFFGYYAVRDIWDDCVKENKEGSDSMACHALYSCCKPRCVGIQFLIVGFLFQVVGIYLALVWLSQNDIK
jgi:hypothetical protein